MPGKIRVVGGTRSSTSKSLCDDCALATRITGMTEQQKIVKCAEIGQVIRFNVEDCSSYQQFGAPSLFDMKQMAVIIDIKGNQVGFYSAAKWRDKQKEVKLPEEYENESQY